MSKFIDLTGHRYNRLTVLSRTEKNVKNGGAYWRCLCECGNETVVSSKNLRSGAVKSCGCLLSETSSARATKRNYKHGLADTRLQKIWSGMKTRCYDQNHVYYHRYGGRGIAVCDEWRDFGTFAQWALENGYRDDLTLDRIDNDGDYEPNNCHWIPMKLQQRNKSTNHNVTVNGETHSLVEWAEINDISYNTILSRLRYGWDDTRAVSTQPLIKHERKQAI